MSGNPISPALASFCGDLRALDFRRAHMIPSALMAIVLISVIVMLAALWPYGNLIVVVSKLWDYVTECYNKMCSVGLIEKMPYTIALGIYFIVWLVFAAVCLPLYLIGLVGHFIAKSFK